MRFLSSKGMFWSRSCCLQAAPIPSRIILSWPTRMKRFRKKRKRRPKQASSQNQTMNKELNSQSICQNPYVLNGYPLTQLSKTITLKSLTHSMKVCKLWEVFSDGQNISKWTFTETFWRSGMIKSQKISWQMTFTFIPKSGLIRQSIKITNNKSRPSLNSLSCKPLNLSSPFLKSSFFFTGKISKSITNFSCLISWRTQSIQFSILWKTWLSKRKCSCNSCLS